MKPLNSLLSVSMFVVALNAGARPAFASESVDVPWDQVCKTANYQDIRATTSAGETVEGYCIAVSVDEMSIRTHDNIVVKIAKAGLSKITVPREHQLEELGRGMRRGLHYGVRHLGTPTGPIGVIALGGTLAWGAVAAPFCIGGDLYALAQGEKEIRPH